MQAVQSILMCLLTCVCGCFCVCLCYCAQRKDLKKGFHRDYLPSSCFRGSKAWVAARVVQRVQKNKFIFQSNFEQLAPLSLIYGFISNPMLGVHSRKLNNDKTMALYLLCFFIVEQSHASRAESLQGLDWEVADTPGPEPCLQQLLSVMKSARTSCVLRDMMQASQNGTGRANTLLTS